MRDIEEYFTNEEKQLAKSMAYCFLIFIIQVTLLFFSVAAISPDKEK